MIKQDSGSLQHYTNDILKLLRMRCQVVDEAERPAVEQALPVESPMHPIGEEQVELTFDNHGKSGSNLGGLSPSSPRYIAVEQHNALLQENEFLKEQLERVKQRISDYEEMLRTLREMQDELACRQADLLDRDTQIENSRVAIKNLEKRRATLQFELNQTTKLLEQQREDQLGLERELHQMSIKIKQKDRQFIDMQSRHSKELQKVEYQKQQVHEQFEAVKEETRRLISKLNSINTQKQQKLYEELETAKSTIGGLEKKIRESESAARELDSSAKQLRESLTESRSQHERAFMNFKLEHQKQLGEARKAIGKEYEHQTEELRKEIERAAKEISRLNMTILSKDNELKHMQEEADRIRVREEGRADRLLQDFDRKVARWESEAVLLRKQLEEKQYDREASHTQICGLQDKISSLDRNLREQYEQSAALEGKILEITRQKTLLTTDCQQLRLQNKNMKELLNHFESKSKSFSNEQTNYLTEIRDLKIRNEHLEEELRREQKRANQLQLQINIANDNELRSHTQLQNVKVVLSQRDINIEKLRYQNEKQSKFIQSYKSQSQRMKENTDRRWRQLKKVYEGQLEALEGRLRAAENRQKNLLVQLETSERQCKDYELELTMSTDIKDFDLRN